MGLRSADPPLLREGGPGNIQSHDSFNGRGIDIVSITIRVWLERERILEI